MDYRDHGKLEFTRTIFFILPALVASFGFVVVVGWLTGDTALLQVSPYNGPMKFIDGLAFMLIGLGLISTMLLRNFLGALLGLIVIFIAVISSIQDIFHINLYIDQLYTHPYLGRISFSPGSMEPNTTLCFILTGIILITYHYYKRYSDRRVILFLFLITISIIFCSFTALIDNFIDLRTLYGWGTYTHMGAETAIGFITWGVCFTAWLKTRSADSLYKKSLFLPASSFVICIFIFGFFSQLIAHMEYKQLQSVLKINEKYIKANISINLSRSVRSLHLWRRENIINEESWPRIVKKYLEKHKSTYAIALFDYDFSLKQIERNDNLKILNLPNRAVVDKISATKLTQLSKPVKIQEQQMGFWILMPLFNKNNVIVNYIGALMPFKVLLEMIPSEQLENEYFYNLLVNGISISKNYADTDDSMKEQNNINNLIKIDRFDYDVSIIISPKKKILERYYSGTALIILFVGFIISLLLSWSMKLYFTLKQVEANARKILASAGEGVYGFDMEGKTTFVNPAAAKMLGWDEHELMGKLKHSIIHHMKKDHSAYLREDCEIGKTLINDAKSYGDNEVFWRKDGTYFPVEYICTPMHDFEGRVIGAVLTFSDTTERKELERMKSEFVSMVNHELRTPLTSIIGALELIFRNSANDLSNKNKAMLNIAYKNSKNLLMLINDLLDIDKLAANKMRFDMKTESLAELITDAVESITPYATKYGVKIQKFSIEREIYISVDAGRFKQVMINLLSNAIKFADKESTVIVYTFFAFEKTVRICVENKGIDIPEEFKSKIFQRYSQSDLTASRKDSSGLGLQITKQLVENMKGKIGFESGNGQTTFWVDFLIETYVKT